MLLTVLVFFNSYVWAMASLITRTRIWLVIAFLTPVAVAFVVTGLLERVRPVLSSSATSDTDDERLAGTPFEVTPDPVEPRSLTRGEWFNVVFVAAASQIAQILMVALVTAAIFFTLGLLVLSQHRTGVFHGRTMATVGPNDPSKTLADNRIPCCRGSRFHGHHHPRRSARPARRPLSAD